MSTKILCAYIENPITCIPYQRVTADMIGLQKRTKCGFRYIFTVMCVGKGSLMIFSQESSAKTVA